MPAEPTEQPPIIAFEDGRLTLRVENQSLDIVLDSISRIARVAIVATDVGDEQVSLQFQDIPFDDALQQILADYDTFYFYGVNEQPPAALSVIWVYPKGQARGLAPVPPEVWASTAEMFTEATGNPDPAARARAIEAVVDRIGDQALDLVLGALSDGAEEVRTRALHGAITAGVNIPAVTLEGLALGDPSADISFLALDGLPAGPNIASIAEQALNDPSPHVRAKAEEILGRLQQATRPPAPSEPAQSGQQSR